MSDMAFMFIYSDCLMLLKGGIHVLTRQMHHVNVIVIMLNIAKKKGCTKFDAT